MNEKSSTLLRRLNSLARKGILRKTVYPGGIVYEFWTNNMKVVKRHVKKCTDPYTIEKFNRLIRAGYKYPTLGIRFEIRNNHIICGVGLYLENKDGDVEWVYEGFNPFYNDEFWTESDPMEEIDFIERNKLR